MRILVISFSDLRSDARVFRQLNALRRRHRVECVAYTDPGLPDVTVHVAQGRVPSYREKLKELPLLALRRYDAYERCFAHGDLRLPGVMPGGYDVVLCNDANALPYGFSVCGDAPVVFDAHEYSPRQYEDVWIWRLFFRPYKEWLCRTYLPRLGGMVTVSEGIAEAYARNFGVPQPQVVTNAADYVELSPSEMVPGKIRLVHHGICAPSRHIDRMLDTMVLLDDRFSLDLFLVPGPPRRYFDAMVSRAEALPRVRIRPPVPLRDVVSTLREYDGGMYILPPSNFNHAHALPNKFFDFVQARLMVAIGPSPEMGRLVRQHQLGVVGEDFSPEALAARLRELTPEQVRVYKENSHRAARELSSETNMAVLERVLEEAARGRSAGAIW
ncbi:MAG TPA: glycosyltransferase [Synergistaceae bacterium]|nr:glycosyltransferase [Synergistaceae bacterium]HQF90850.1 glycosyltransferase [Synergistaceae bacterium]HQH77993.1 glycosyltransferase [Synergistaceae bacterium]HQK25527.1 glycosyltransferase [Synergistaceae bacterium]